MTSAHVLDQAHLDALATRSSAQRAAALLAIDHFAAVPLEHRLALLDEARGWLADCGWPTAARDSVDEVLVRQLVHRAYDGGWPGFVVTNVGLLGASSTN